MIKKNEEHSLEALLRKGGTHFSKYQKIDERDAFQMLCNNGNDMSEAVIFELMCTRGRIIEGILAHRALMVIT